MSVRYDRSGSSRVVGLLCPEGGEAVVGVLLVLSLLEVRKGRKVVTPQVLPAFAELPPTFAPWAGGNGSERSVRGRIFNAHRSMADKKDAIQVTREVSSGPLVRESEVHTHG